MAAHEFKIEKNISDNRLLIHCEGKVINENIFIAACVLVQEIFEKHSEDMQKKTSDKNLTQINANLYKDLFAKFINDQQEIYPISMKTKDLSEILNCSTTQVYKSLKKGLIPGAKNINGIGWRINRDIFFSWLYLKEKDI
ncbi:MAG: helix-turn-helix domain-containing protein [bacterium]